MAFCLFCIFKPYLHLIFSCFYFFSFTYYNKQEDDDNLDLKANLEQMEIQMQREATMIAEAFEAIDRTRQTMEKRLFILNNP